MCTTPATPLIVGSTASAIILPLDILDLVFAEIAQDAKTLSQCSLVCKFWSAGARRQLFRTVILAIRSSDSLTDIVGFLQDFRANSHWIRNVIFRGFWEPLRPSLLVTCLDMLPELHSLVLDQVELGWEDNAQLEAGPTPKCRLGTLDLRRVSFLNPHNLMGVICVFAEIHTIIATHVDTWLERDLLMDATTWEPCSPDFTRPTVQKFKATEVFPFQSVAWLYKALATRTSPGSLTSLDFACVTMKNVHSFCAWLSAEGSRTTSLRLDLSPSGSLMDPRAPVRYDHAADHATSRGFDIHLQQIGLTDLKSLTIVGGTNRVTDVKDHVVRAFGL
ncbi:hypothetical protein BC835DRAFT_196341 [Cytidiella melzeri]|nr:hypothetical protein BC835DRAFT_196341 [Cytidiella melzeri]